MRQSIDNLRNKVSTLGILIPLLVGCEQFKVTPVDVKGLTIVGHWYSEHHSKDENFSFSQKLYLHVREDGYAQYVNLLCRHSENGSVSESRLALDYLPIKHLSQKKMVLQSYPLTTQFELLMGRWPNEQESVFNVDTLSLESITEESAPDTTSWACKP